MTLRSAFANFREGISLAGRLLAIVLAVLITDFAVNSLMFERENAVAVNSEEAARMAEHLVVARRVLEARPWDERQEVARQLSTERFQIGWRARRSPHPQGEILNALRDQVVGAERELSDADLRLHISPLTRGGGIRGSALLRDGSAMVFSTSNVVSRALDYGLLIRFSLPSMVLFAIAWWLVRRSFRPLYQLVRATARVGTDDMEPVVEAGQAEVRQLIRAFNRMHDRIRQLLENRTQTLLAIGHDLRTPLARLQMRLDSIALDDMARADMGADIAEMGDLLNSLQTYVQSGRESGPPEPLDLACMVRTQVDDAEDLGWQATYDGPDNLEVNAHPLSVRRAIANLIQNALRYAGNVEVCLGTSGDMAELKVADRGPGIPEDRLDEVLLPFTRLDEARARDTRGMGLGLAIVDRIIAAEGGKLALANREGGGLVATITLPLRAFGPPPSPSSRNTS